MKKAFWGVIFLSQVIFVTDFCQKKTKGFTQGKIAPAFAKRSFAIHEEEFSSILDQPFTYLKKGNSAFVLVSQDQKYVLKFLRKSHLNASFWTKFSLIRTLFPDYCNPLIQEKEITKQALLKSYKLAEHLKDQTGIIYSHLFLTDHLKKNITFYDNIKVKHTISADQTAFILQKKAEPFCPYFKSLSLDRQKKLLQEFAQLLLERSQKGILDKDISPHYNLGILDGHFITFDLDSLKSSPPSILPEERQNHMLLEGKKMLRFLKSVHSDLPFFLENEIEKLSHLS